VEIEFFADALTDLDFWKKSGNKVIQKKLDKLFVALLENPYEGIGKPEALKYDLSGRWSRRINSEHRMIYEVRGELIKIYSLRGHY
jgi:toxin YoeB